MVESIAGTGMVGSSARVGEPVEMVDGPGECAPVLVEGVDEIEELLFERRLVDDDIDAELDRLSVERGVGSGAEHRDEGVAGALGRAALEVAAVDWGVGQTAPITPASSSASIAAAA